MAECTGLKICEEWLYHIGVPEKQIKELARNHAVTIPCMMPYVTSYFMVRDVADRPNVVPEGACNFAFIGERVETPRDTVFTTEYAVCTAMEAVYTLLARPGRSGGICLLLRCPRAAGCHCRAYGWTQDH